MRARGVLRLRVGPTSLRADALHGSMPTWSGETRYDGLTDLSDAIARLAAEPPSPCRRLDVVLERPLVQLRTLHDLPPVKARALTALVAHQAGRFFRRNGQALVTDAVWVTNGTGRVACAAAAEEPLVEAIAMGARAAGLRLTGIAPADVAAPLLLLPIAERAARLRAARRRLVRLAVAAGLAWVAAGTLYVGRLAWERRAVARELAIVERPLTALLDARHEIRDAAATVRAIGDAERLRDKSVGVLGGVTRALPDSSVLTSLAWSADGAGSLTGSARRAAAVVAALDRTGALAAPRLEGPVVRETLAGREWEQFTIVFGGEKGKTTGP